jgi:hypothetical protein
MRVATLLVVYYRKLKHDIEPRQVKVANESDHTKNTTRKLNSYERLCSRKEKENKNDYCTCRPL